ncbi:TM6S2 protein, partial [Leucopsar rothschildi]|nr:TM6S2 protein [Leucopsar rothschildi]
LALAAILVLFGLVSLLILTGGAGLVQDPLFCVFVVFSFASAVDLIIALEEDGIISGFMELYVREGDPHLRTAHGLLTCYWDGTVHYGLCLAMAGALGKRRSYRALGLFWLGSLLMSAVVFLLGNLIGTAVWRVRGALGGALSGPGGVQRGLEELGGFLEPPGEDLGGPGRVPCPRPPLPPQVVLDCPADSCFDYTYLHEPYLRDPVGYPKVQMLIYLFYLLPFLLLAIYGLAWPGCSWLPDWSLLVAGAVAQAQFAHLGSSLHSRTPFPYQTPDEVLWSFLLSNVLYALGPQLLALRCLRSPAFFLPAAAPGLARAKKYQ